MKKVKVFLSDWQTLFREGVHLTLCSEESYEVVGEATTSEEALEFIEENCPGVAILNAGHGELTGIDVTHRVKQNLPSVAMILMMDNDNCEEIMAALKGGASACISKDIEPEDLRDTVRRTVQGEYPIINSILKPAVAAMILAEFEYNPDRKDASTLFARLLPLEAQILGDITGGKKVEDIIRERRITEDNFRQCLYVIRGKMVANSRNNTPIES